MNLAAARIARRCADDFAHPDRPRWVAGVIGPTNRSASISPDVNDPGARNIRFDDLVDAYAEAARGLLAGGADLIMIETVFDTLNAKAALFAMDDVFADAGRRLPIMVSGTITDASGRTLSGQTPEAFWYSVQHAEPLIVGLNCALGSEALRPHVEALAQVATTFVSVHPNAGLPDEFGEYNETPEQIGQYRRRLHGPGARQPGGRLLWHDPRAYPRLERPRPGQATAPVASSPTCACAFRA